MIIVQPTGRIPASATVERTVVWLQARPRRPRERIQGAAKATEPHLSIDPDSMAGRGRLGDCY